MICTCAWCQKEMGLRAPFDDLSETHGICRACKNKHFPRTVRGGVLAVFTRIDGISTCVFDRRVAL
jgi:hypothetical protein